MNGGFGQRCLHWPRLLGLCLWVCASLSALPARAQLRPSALTWQAPSAAQRLAWPDPTRQPVVDLDPSGPLELRAGEVVLVPIKAGDHLRVRGAGVMVGWASGALENHSDVITWQKPGESDTWRVPGWSGARFLALTSERSSQARVEIAARTHDALGAHRLQQAVDAWLRKRTPLPKSDRVEDARDLLILRGQAELLERALPAELRARELGPSGAGTWLLATLWLERRLRERPLVDPFFTPMDGELRNLEPASPDPRVTADESWQQARGGDVLELVTDREQADVVSVSLRAQALGQSRVQIWEGDALMYDRSFSIPRRAENPARWTPPLVLRLATPARRDVQVRVLEGTVLLDAQARRAEHSLFESARAHAPTALRQSAPRLESLPAWFADVLSYQLTHGAATMAALERHLSSSDAAGGSLPNPAARALLLEVALPQLVQRTSLPEELEAYWDGTSALPPAERSALFAALLRRLHDTLSDPVDVESLPDLLAKSDGLAAAVESPVLRALFESVVSTHDGAPALAASELETIAARNASDSWLLEASRQTWQRTAPWATLSAPGAPERVLQRRPFDANQPSGLCENDGSRGLRWWLVPQTPTEIEVQDLGGTHSALRFMPLDPENLAASAVQIDGQLIHVQPALGEVSRAGVRPGRRVITLASGPPVLARIPRGGVSPCEELLEPERWSVLDGELRFEVPPAPITAVASVIVDPISIPIEGARVEISVADSVHVAWVRRPASGDIELTVPSGSDELVVRADRPLLIRARLRRHPSERHDPTPVVRPRLPPEAEALAEIERLTAALRGSAEASEREALRSARAELLHGLGYRELAEIDWKRAKQPEMPAARSRPDAMFLPDSPMPVIPIGLAARAPILPVLDPELARRALGLRRLGQSTRSLEALRDAGSLDGSTAEALLGASLAAELDDTELAARIIERLAHATSNGGLYDAAARHYDRLAGDARDLKLARRAHLLAKLAEHGGVPMSTFLARYESRGTWHAPSLSAIGDSLTIVAPENEARDVSLSERVRAALTLAPREARLFSSHSSFNVQRFRGQTLFVSSACFSREGPFEGCQAEILLDDQPVICPPAASDPDLALPRQCPVQLGPTARQLNVRLPGDVRCTGWALLRQQDPNAEAESLIPLTWHQSYTQLVSTKPIRLALAGPGVLRVQARGREAAPRPLLLSDQAFEDTASARSPENAPRRAELTFPERGLSSVVAGQTRLEVSPEHRFEYVIAGSGVRQITLSTQGLPLLIRPATFELTSLPEPETQASETAPPKDSAVATRQHLVPPWPTVEPRYLAPLSLSAEASFEDKNITEADNDQADRFVEPAIVVRKALIEDQLFAELRALARLRDGPTSVGAAATLSFSPSERIPGAFAGAEFVAQPDLRAAGLTGSVGLRQRIDLEPRLALLPELGVTFRAVGPPRPEPGADNDVYSAYANSHPRSYDAKLVLAHRPFLDGLFRHSLGVRMNPDAVSLDRVDARSDLDLLPGRDHTPWLGVGASASYRAASALRQDAFTRLSLSPAVTAWHWLHSGSRLRTDFSFSIFVDLPNPSGARAGLFAALVVGYDFLLGNGLEDFRITSKPFRARLEEGGPPPAPSPATSDAYWKEASAE